MLFSRILTAAILIPLVIVAIFVLPPLGLSLIVAALMLVGAWEWAGLNQLHGYWKAGYVGIGGLLMMVALLSAFVPEGLVVDRLIVMVATLFWVAVSALIRIFPKGWKNTLGRRVLAVPLSLALLCAPVVAVVYIDRGGLGPWMILLLCMMVWGADTGAYIAGRLYGRHKLAPNVSPGKTMEGAWGGMAASILIGLIVSLALGLGSGPAFFMAILGGWIAAVSILGDLTLSMFKRATGIKDSGRLFPGHGGVLDRLDSMLAAAPWYVVGLYLLGIAS